MQFKKILCVVLMFCLLLSSLAVISVNAQENLPGDTTSTQEEVNSTKDEATRDEKDYGLMENIQDGNILHAFCWKHTDIIAMLPQIAEAGFTAVQISPVQATAGTGSWWWMYMPLGFSIGDTAMGDKESLAQLCAEADKYGVQVVVNVVANHLAGDHSVIQSDLQDQEYWHNYNGTAIDGDRISVINGMVGMPDLNTSDAYVQKCVRNYVLELKSVGVDGICWDAAKHIGLPSEGDNFWSAVTKDTGLFHYGEILNNPGVDAYSEHGKALLAEYSEYMSITDTVYGFNIRNAFNAGQAPTSIGNFDSLGISADKLVYWAENHDTWSNNQDWGYSNGMTQNTIDRAYAVAGSRDGATAIYLSRPLSAVRDNITIGTKGSTHFTSKEVAAVNHFRNAMNGQDEYVTTANNCAIVCREKGAVIVAGEGQNFEVTLPNNNSLTKPGTYTDQVSGSTWTVTETTITGEIGSSGIAVIYDPNAAEDTTVILGDADLNSEINIKDATLIQKNVANIVEFTDAANLAADVNADKTVNVKDATAIQKYVAGTKSDYKIGETVIV